MKHLPPLFVTMLFILMHSIVAHAQDCTVGWRSHSKTSRCEYIDYQTIVSYPVTSIFGNSPDSALVKAKIRAGYLEENKSVSFKGNVLYFEGLADSMVNHMPLFKKLTAQGFRVIAFDYMGQGGSTGSMNDTRLLDIPTLGKIVYQKFARDLVNFKRPMIIGWSTGGVAAYLTAINNEAGKVVLIAPGIVPKVILGEHDFWELDFNIITLRTLTSKTYIGNEYNPHVDGIRPRSPLAVKDFATDLILTSMKVRSIKADTRVSGLVLHSGKNDTYVNSLKGSFKLDMIAPHFNQFHYPQALHEIDNEIEPIQKDVHQRIIQFLLSK